MKLGTATTPATPVRNARRDTLVSLNIQTSLELHLKCEPDDASLQNARDLPERAADAVVPGENGVAVQRVEQVDLPAERLAAGAEVLSEVHVELVVPGIVQRTRRVQHDGF